MQFPSQRYQGLHAARNRCPGSAVQPTPGRLGAAVGPRLSDDIGAARPMRRLAAIAIALVVAGVARHRPGQPRPLGRRPVHGAGDLRRRRRSRPAARTSASPAPTSARSSRSRSPPTSAPRSRCSIDRFPVHPLPCQRPLRDPPPVADRRAVRRLQPGHRRRAPAGADHQGPGAGSYLLPVTRTSSPVDSDIVQDISREPVRQSLAVIIDELGTGLAARGSDLNAVIHRANPALGDTDKVLQILASQNHALAQLATNSDTVLAPLARERRQISGFITQANTTSVASAQRAADISRTFQLFPSFLSQLRPLMADLGTLADQGTPVMTELGQSADAVGRQFANLTPVRRRRAHRADRPRPLGLGVPAVAGGHTATGPAPGPLGHRRSADRRLTAAAAQQPQPDRRHPAADEPALQGSRRPPTASTASDITSRFEPLDSSCTDYVSTVLPGARPTSAASRRRRRRLPPGTQRREGGRRRSPRPATGSSPPPCRNASGTASGAKAMSGLLSYLVGSKR